MVLSDPTLDPILAKALGLKPPAYLYRYAPAGASLAFLEQFVLKGEIWLSSRDDFNDPYDCMPAVKFPTGELARAKMLKQSRERVRGGGGSPEAERGADILVRQLRRAPRHVAEAYAAEAFKQIASRIGIRCFAEAFDDVVMWAHYADFHRGICLRLNMARWPKPKGVILAPVTYRGERPAIGMPGNDAFNAQLTAALLTKAEGWRGEREWRYLAHNAAHTTVSVPHSTVDVVYVGAKADEETFDRVQSWKRARPDLRVCRMSLSKTTFDLTSGPLI